MHTSMTFPWHYYIPFNLTELQNLLMYAKGCLEFKNYFECIEVCDAILSTSQSSKSNNPLLMQAKIVKGIAKFYSYKRKLSQILVNTNIRATEEGRKILDECFNSMKEAIALLGNGLDQNMLDDEGSKILDWAMLDCLSTTNQLNLCKRCLLCRQQKPLRKSHVWPKFIAKSFEGEKFIFGLDKHQLKSVGTCTYWMLCERCESLLSQNGEDEFKKEFPSSGEIMYSSQLFSFCAGVIFRCLSTSVILPMHFNDSDIYKVILQCRKHLLSLPVTINKKPFYLSDAESRQLQELTHQLNGDLSVFLFVSPLNSKQNYGVVQSPYPRAASALSRNKQLDGNRLFFNGYVHFYLVCCGPVTIIVKFDNTVNSILNKGFHITSNPMESDQKYTILSEEERIKILPMGVWNMMEQLTVNKVFEVARFISKRAKVPPPATAQSIQAKPSVDIPSVAKDHNTVFEVSFLPKEYEVIKPHARLPRNRCVVLPQGHQTIIHANLTVPALKADYTFLLCISESESSHCDKCLYVIIIEQVQREIRLLYVDGAKVVIENGKLVLKNFLMTNAMAEKSRSGLFRWQQLLDRAALNKHFDNINLLMYLVKCRRYVLS